MEKLLSHFRRTVFYALFCERLVLRVSISCWENRRNEINQANEWNCVMKTKRVEKYHKHRYTDVNLVRVRWACTHSIWMVDNIYPHTLHAVQQNIYFHLAVRFLANSKVEGKTTKEKKANCCFGNVNDAWIRFCKRF